MTHVWVFNGNWAFPSGVFSTREAAEAWIATNALAGCLTRYPVDVGVYDWAVTCGAFKPKNEIQRSPEFIGRFSSASLEHYHYEGGVKCA